MAKINYTHVFAGAGFSGETWDIAQGYNQSYSSTAGDAAFLASGKTITLTTGTFPAWAAEPGKEIDITGTTSNDGTYTVVSLDGTSKILTVKETLVDETPAGVTVFDGSIDTAIQDILLKTGNGALLEDAPHVLESTGALGAARTLDISGMEVELAARGGMDLPGRFFYLSVRNTDVSSTNSITVSAGLTINGAATFVINNTGDYLFHHTKDGAWRVNLLPRPDEQAAVLKRIPFVAADWDAGAVNDTIKVIQTGTAAAGEVGPHEIAAYDSYLVQIINTDLSPNEIVDVEVQFDSNGDVILKKARKAADFAGIVVISGTLD